MSNLKSTGLTGWILEVSSERQAGVIREASIAGRAGNHRHRRLERHRKAAAILLAERGVNVVLGDLSGTAGEAVASEILATGGQACFVPMDISRDADCAALVDMAVATCGRLDGAFSNAATFSFGKRLAAAMQLEI